MGCTFSTECLEGEDCLESGYTLTVETALRPGSLAQEGGLPTEDTIVTDTETFAITWLASRQGLAAVAATSSGFQMLSVAPDGTARYSVHLPLSDLSIHYIGTCEGT
ncbi:MAG: hypothetical protein AAFW64_00495 [Pseudomonadota bacterium]